MDARAIGVFDSGIGGLTVMAEILRALPDEKVIYFGDTARLPYGTKSRDTVRKFARQIVRFLQHFPIKMIVVACNTVSAEALRVLQEENALPIIGVVEPGAKAGVAATACKRIGVIGTTGTIKSGAYQKAILRLRPEMEVFARDCPLFVPLVEEGWTSDPITVEVARRYLAGLADKGIDTLILGCTHYPLIKPVLQHVMGDTVRLVDSATETAHEIAATLAHSGLQAATTARPPTHQFFVSDFSAHFKHIGERCLGQPLGEVLQIDLDEFETMRLQGN